MKKYINFTVNKVVTVKNLITLEHINVSPDFTYPKEAHDFYEFAYVDNGSISCFCNDVKTMLNQNDFYLIKPGEKHYYKANKVKNTSIFIACFSCKTDILQIISGKNTVNDNDKIILSKILSEAHNAFKFPFNKKLQPCENPIFGAQQLINNAIEEVLISIIRQKLDEQKEISLVSNKDELHSNVVKDIKAILKQNIFGKITLDEISERVFFSKTYINKIFKKITGTTIMDYYIDLKIKESIKMLKNGHSITDTALKLNFDTPNYFSKVFKNKLGMLPSSYKYNKKII
ncbi:MAG: AraC family transcriptional regulator [Clostridia bacterium]|nr:AraC family transcriptional regulator [Clostridia bacterium]